MNKWNDLNYNKKDKENRPAKSDSISVSELCRRERMDTIITVSRIATRKGKTSETVFSS